MFPTTIPSLRQAACAVAFAALLPLPGAAATFLVNSTADDPDSVVDGVCATAAGSCTLRAALQEANSSPGPDSIEFAIDSGLQTIAPTSELPTVIDSVVIDGQTQPLFNGAPLIVLDGRRMIDDGLTITGGGATIRGLVIRDFSREGVVLHGAGGNVIEGCYIGTDATGSVAAGNGRNGVVILDSAANRIGGLSPLSRNVISGNRGIANHAGLKIQGSLASGNIVQGNYIGTDVTGMLGLGNSGRGVTIVGAPDNIIGGPEPGAGNLVSGNRATGIRILDLGAEGNIVEGNLVGANAQGGYGIPNDRGIQARTPNNQILRNTVIGNRNDGIALLFEASHTLVEGNVVVLNGFGPHSDPVEAGYSGIAVYGGTGNRLRSNLIIANALLGIALQQGGVTPNDFRDLDTGPNGLQNFPVINSATLLDGLLDMRGVLWSQANSTYDLEFFASPKCGYAGFGQGLLPVGEAQVSTNAIGRGDFTVQLETTIAAGWFVTATATDSEGSTSEFSPCAALQ